MDIFKPCIDFLIVICGCSFRTCFQAKLSIKTVCTKVFLMFLNGFNYPPFRAVNKFWSRRPHWESRRRPAFRASKARVSPPRKFWNLDAWKCYFQCFLDSIWPLKTIKIKTILTIFYVYYNHSFPQNLNHWLLEKSKMINLQTLIKKK